MKQFKFWISLLVAFAVMFSLIPAATIYAVGTDGDSNLSGTSAGGNAGRISGNASASNTDFILCTLFTDNMLLQRNKEVKIFGYGGNIGDSVKVEFAGQTKTAAIESEDGWAVYLDPLEASATGRPLTVTYTRKGDSTPTKVITLQDVVVGELWLGAGQSNMWFHLSEFRSLDTNNDLKPYDEIENLDKIRFYYVEPVAEYEPKIYTTSNTYWVTPQEGNINGYSATGLGFAAQLQLSLGEDVPVGILSCSLGGTFIEEWLDEETVEKTGSVASHLDSRLYNGMVHNFKGMTLGGILWYQGENNVYAGGLYESQMMAYVELYRKLFEDAQLPVIQFQLPQFDQQAWHMFRQTQWDLMEKVDNLYTVCGIDLGNPNDIHPTDKWPFTGRAVGTALKYVYNMAEDEMHEDQTAYGLSPYVTKAEWTDAGIVLSVSDAKTLTVAGSIDGFEGFNGMAWVKLSASVQGNQILLTGDHDKITVLRYLQAPSFTGDIFIYNEYGLPVAPFSYISRNEPTGEPLNGDKLTLEFADVSELDNFDLFTSGNTGFNVVGGALRSGIGAEMKAVVKNGRILRNMDVSVDILPATAGGRLNGGLYILASAAAGGQDAIKAWNIQIERDADSRDLRVSLHRFDNEKGYTGTEVTAHLYSYLARSEMTAPVNLRAVEIDGKLSVYIDGLLLWKDLNVSELVQGSVGSRSHQEDMLFDNFVFVTDKQEPHYGDVNGDGVVDSLDARLVLQYREGLESLNAQEQKAADYTEDGVVDDADADAILEAVVQQGATTGSDVQTQTYYFINAAEMNDFVLYNSSEEGNLVLSGGKLVATEAEAEYKAIVKAQGRKYSRICVDIYPGANGIINAGVYLDASNVKNELDGIDAVGILVQSDFAGWADAGNRLDLVVGSFPTWQELHRVTSETASGNSLFAGGVKEPVKLGVVLEDNTLQITVSLLSEPSIFVQTTYAYTGDKDLSGGAIGLRAYGCDCRFDNLTLEYTETAE